MGAKHAIIAMSVLLPVLACGTVQEVSSVGPQNPHPLPAGSVVGALRAGRDPVLGQARPEDSDTLYTPPGTRLPSATTTAPLLAGDGRVVVPSGAKIRGWWGCSSAMPMLRSAHRPRGHRHGRGPRAAPRRRARGTTPRLGRPPHHHAPRGVVRVPVRLRRIWRREQGARQQGARQLVTRRSTRGSDSDATSRIDVPAGAILQLRLSVPLALPEGQVTR